jgi:CheY-like chemotaxis protein
VINILLVEDNLVFRESFKQSLHELFPDVVIEEASSGEEGLQKVNGHPPHLIFMDLRLPGMNGLQATRKIKSDFPDIPIAILTG